MIRLLFWLMELGALFALASVAFFVLSTLGRSFTGVLRAAANVVIAGTMSIGVGIVTGIATAVAQSGDPIGSGLLATIVALPVTLWLLDRLGRRRADRGVVAGFTGARERSAPEPAADAVVASAWSRAGRLAPSHRHRLASAREACAYVLHWSQTHPMDMDTMECAVLIRKRLPELVDKTDTYCQLAARDERRTVIDGMVGDIESLGRMALHRVSRAKAQLGDSLAATRAHIASRTGDGALL